MDLDFDIEEIINDILLSNLKESQYKLKEYFDIDNWSEPEFSDEEIDGEGNLTFINCSSETTFAGETIKLITKKIGIDTSDDCDTALITNKRENIYIDDEIDGPVEEFNNFGKRVIFDSDHKKWIKFMTDSLPKLPPGSDQAAKVLRYILEKT